ncbi:RNA-binding protein 34-like [Diadema setosum]|uniref:RNA-binding protein 34-like n=1 Tax=Diadema setosum TaxID=31175 RepID=UPI003B3AE5AD
MKKKRQKQSMGTEGSQEEKAGSSQLSGSYVPGSIASFLSTSSSQPAQGESSGGGGALTSFFKPSVQKKTTALPGAPSFEKRTNTNEGGSSVGSDQDGSESLGALSPTHMTANTKRSHPQSASLQGTDDEAESEPKRKKIADQMTDDPAVLARTVFVGNLPLSVKKKELKGLFKVYGHIESIRFRSMGVADPNVSKKVAAIKKELTPNRSSFNAYIVFKDDQCAQAALKSNGWTLHKHHLRVDIAGNSKKHDLRRSVFVGNIPFKVEEEELHDHFHSCGAIEGVRLIRDKETGVGKGFGYILFEDPSSVQFALKMNGTKLKGRGLRVKRAVKKEKQKDQRISFFWHYPSGMSNQIVDGRRGQSAQRRNSQGPRAKGRGFQGNRGRRKPLMGKGKAKGRKS